MIMFLLWFKLLSILNSAAKKRETYYMILLPSNSEQMIIKAKFPFYTFISLCLISEKKNQFTRLPLFIKLFEYYSNVRLLPRRSFLNRNAWKQDLGKETLKKWIRSLFLFFPNKNKNKPKKPRTSSESKAWASFKNVVK